MTKNPNTNQDKTNCMMEQWKWILYEKAKIQLIPPDQIEKKVGSFNEISL